MQDFLRGRVELARALMKGTPAVACYADVALVTCAVLSACASHRWPGRGIDKQRFIELLVRHSPPSFRTSWVCVPALLNDGLISQNQTPYGRPGHSARIHPDDAIDLSLEEAKRKYPKVCAKELRRHCYAYLVYERLRCGYAHEYRPGRDVTEHPPSSKDARLSYIGRLGKEGTRRMLAVHLEYLLRLAEHHVSNLPETKCCRPSLWWIDGE